MHIVIESTVGGSFAGFLHCTISGSENLGSLISRYCESKVRITTFLSLSDGVFIIIIFFCLGHCC